MQIGLRRFSPILTQIYQILTNSIKDLNSSVRTGIDGNRNTSHRENAIFLHHAPSYFIFKGQNLVGQPVVSFLDGEVVEGGRVDRPEYCTTALESHPL